jgi:hypothetical protein
VPERPALAYDDRAVKRAHRRVYEAAGTGVVHGLVVRAKRTAGKAWQFATVVLSVEEHTALEERRKPIDAAVEEELGRLAEVPGLQWIWFGRRGRNQPSELVIKHDGVELRPPTGVLAAIMAKADDLYRAVGLEPIVLKWVLEDDEVDFMEHFE